MHVILPDLMAEMRDLPLLAPSLVALVGVLLWTTGWMAHRFWIVLATTFAAGMVGLRVGPDYGLQPIVAGLLLAAGAGCLALALARVAIFIWYGLVCWYLVQQYAPQLAVPVVCILIGGFFTVVFYKFCVMMLLSAAGMVLTGYGGLELVDRFLGVNAVRLVAENLGVINSGYLGSILIGALVQHVVEKNHKKYKAWRADYMEWKKKKSAGAGGKSLLAWLPRLRRAA
jgi:hypothetical protein